MITLVINFYGLVSEAYIMNMTQKDDYASNQKEKYEFN